MMLVIAGLERGGVFVGLDRSTRALRVPSRFASCELPCRVRDSALAAQSLMSCNARVALAGFLLVNSTINTQECLFCVPSTYSFNPFDKCGSDVCGLRECFPCSVGADCGGGFEFIPKVSTIDDWRKGVLQICRDFLSFRTS